MNILDVDDDNDTGPVIVHDDPDSYPSLISNLTQIKQLQEKQKVSFKENKDKEAVTIEFKEAPKDPNAVQYKLNSNQFEVKADLVSLGKYFCIVLSRSMPIYGVNIYVPNEIFDSYKNNNLKIGNT